MNGSKCRHALCAKRRKFWGVKSGMEGRCKLHTHHKSHSLQNPISGHNINERRGPLFAGPCFTLESISEQLPTSPQSSFDSKPLDKGRIVQGRSSVEVGAGLFSAQARIISNEFPNIQQRAVRETGNNRIAPRNCYRCLLGPKPLIPW